MSKKEKIIYHTYLLVNPIIVNERTIKQVDISSHCDKHLEHGVTHELIIELVKLLDKKYFPPDGLQSKEKWFFRALLRQKDKEYKLVWWWWINKSNSILYVRTCHPI